MKCLFQKTNKQKKTPSLWASITCWVINIGPAICQRDEHEEMDAPSDIKGKVLGENGRVPLYN